MKNMMRIFEKLLFLGCVLLINVKIIYCDTSIEKYERDTSIKKYEQHKNEKLIRSTKGCSSSCKVIEPVIKFKSDRPNLFYYGDFDKNFSDYFYTDSSKNECVVQRINGISFYFCNYNDAIITVSVWGISKKIGIINLNEGHKISPEDKKKFKTNFAKYFDTILLNRDIYFNICSPENPYIIKVNFRDFITYGQPVIGPYYNSHGKKTCCYFIPFNIKDQINAGAVLLEHRFFYDVINDIFIDLCDSLTVDFENMEGENISKTILDNGEEENVVFLYIIRSKNKRNILDDCANINIDSNNKDCMDYYYIFKNHIVKIVFEPKSDVIGIVYFSDEKIPVGYLQEVNYDEFKKVLEGEDYRNVPLSAFYYKNLAPEYQNYNIDKDYF